MRCVWDMAFGVVLMLTALVVPWRVTFLSGEFDWDVLPVVTMLLDYGTDVFWIVDAYLSATRFSFHNPRDQRVCGPRRLCAAGG